MEQGKGQKKIKDAVSYILIPKTLFYKIMENDKVSRAQAPLYPGRR